MTYRKIGLLTLFFAGIFLLTTSFQWFPAKGLWVAVLVCWFFDSLAIMMVDIARQKSENGIVGVWIGIAPRLSGPMFAAFLITMEGNPETQKTFLAALTYTYIVSLPVVVYLTLPAQKRNRG